jgi:hypothetical protein
MSLLWIPFADGILDSFHIPVQTSSESEMGKDEYTQKTWALFIPLSLKLAKMSKYHALLLTTIRQVLRLP